MSESNYLRVRWLYIFLNACQQTLWEMNQHQKYHLLIWIRTEILLPMGICITIKLLEELIFALFFLSLTRMSFKNLTKDSLGSSLKTSAACLGLYSFSSVKYRPISLMIDLVLSSVITTLAAEDEVELSPNSSICLLRWCFVRPPFDLQTFSQKSQGKCLFPST